MGDGFDTLRMCATALDSGNVNLANDLMKKATEYLAKIDSSYENRPRVIANYFAQALARRAYGLHPKRPYSTRRANENLLGGYYIDGIFLAVTKAIEDAIRKQNKMHIIAMSSIDIRDIEYGLSYEGESRVTPLFIKLSLIVHPDDHCEIAKSKEKLENLSEDFRYSNQIALDCEMIQVESFVDIDMSRLKIESDEFVVVKASFVLGEMLFEPVTLNKFLVMLRDLVKPDLLIIAERDQHYTQSNNFTQRFNESLRFYSHLHPSFPDFRYNEHQQLIRYEISNLMACEGSKRVVRHMTLGQWQHLLNKFGFSSTPVIHSMWDDDILNKLITYGFPEVSISAWKLTQGSKPSSFVEVKEYLSMIFRDTDDFPSYQISPKQHCYLIRMASLAEIYDMLQDVSRSYADFSTPLMMRTWTSCTMPHSFQNTWSSQLNPCLFIADEFHGNADDGPNYWQSELGYHLNGENHVTKALESNRPCYRAKPHKHSVYGYEEFDDGFAVKLSSLHANFGDYVVEFLIEFKDRMSFEEKKSWMNNIVSDLKNKQTIFVTCRTEGPVVELHETTATLSLDNEINRINFNVVVPLPQLPHDDQANDVQEGLAPNVLPTRGIDLLAQSTGDFELDLSLNTWMNQTTRDDMEIDGPHHQPSQSKLQCGNKPFNDLTSSSALAIILWEDDAKKLLHCCLITQFIDDTWKLKKQLLSFKKVEHGSSGMSLTEVINILLSEWNLEKVLSLTIHNKSSLDDKVERRGNWPSKMLLLNYDKCLNDIHYKDDERIVLARICEMYRTMNPKGVYYPLMDVEINNEQRICSLVLAFVTVLNPQLKFRHVKSKYEEIYDGHIAAKEHLMEIYAFLTKHYYAYSSTTTTVVNPDLSELDRYLKEDNVSTTELDILKWWRDNSCIFPTLGKIAREFLAIPLSTVTSYSATISELMKSNSTKKRKAIAGEEHIKEPKSAWSEQNVRDYLIYPFTTKESRFIETYRKRKVTGEIHYRLRTSQGTKGGTLPITDKVLVPLCRPLDDVLMQSTPEKFYVNDTIMEAFFIILKKRYNRFPEKYLKHYSFSSFMPSKLLKGENVSKWFQLEDLSGVEKLFQPFCFSNPRHWVLFYVDIKDKRLQWLDPWKDSQNSHEHELRVISEWYKGYLLPRMGHTDASRWIVEVQDAIPTQKNSIDCGIFVMKYADCLTHGHYFPFSQEDMPHFRKRIFLDIFNGNINVPRRFY